MYTSIVSLQTQLEKAKERLKGVEEDIKKNIGRDINTGPGNNRAAGFKRGVRHLEDGDGGKEGGRKVFLSGGRNTEPWGNPENRSREHDFRGRAPRPVRHNNFNMNQPFNSMRGRNEEKPTEERIPVKRRLGEQQAITVFSRLSGPPKDEEFEEENTVKMSSQVIVQDLPSRKDILMAQSGDNKCKERNKRMFGALLGTLQKFQQEENKLKEKEDKRAQVERKLEEAAQREKEEAKRARQELFSSRRQQQMEIRKLEFKLVRLKQLSEWEATKLPLKNFIQTKASPKIYFLPKIHNSKSEDLLSASRAAIEKIIEQKRAEVEKAISDHIPNLIRPKVEKPDEPRREAERDSDHNRRGEDTDDDDDDKGTSEEREDGEISSKTEEMIIETEEPVSDKENMTEDKVEPKEEPSEALLT